MAGSRTFLVEMKRRRMWRTAAVYAASAFVAIQVADLAFPAMDIPDQALRFVWITALVGFPIALLFGWRYQVTSHGVFRTAPAAAGEGTELPLERRDYLILAGLGGLAGLLLLQLGIEIRGAPGSMALEQASFDIPPNTIAVLPLQNVTGDPEEDYFAAGMHDALITTMSRIGALAVKAASSARVYENVVQPARQTGRELGAAHLVEGSVFRTGERVRVNVRLISTATEENVWSESYERRVEDVLTLQAEVSRAIADAVQVRVTPEEASLLASARTVDPEVYETYLKGMFHLNKYTPEGVRQGLAYLHEAVELGPDDPLAYAGLAQGYTLIGHSTNPPPDAFARAQAAAARALELDPLFPEAHAAMAEIQLYYDWDWDGAERSFRRALQLNPNLEVTHAHYAWYHQLMGDIEPAIEHMARARQIAPVTPIFTAWLGWLYWADGQYERAAAEARRSLELNEAFPWGLYVLGGTHAALEEFEEAVATFERLHEIAPKLGRWGLALTYAQMGRSDDAHRVIELMAERPGQKDLLLIALAHAILGEVDESVRWLRRAHDVHVDWFPYVAAHAGYDHFVALGLANLRGSPDYQRLVEPLGIPQPD